MFSLDALYNIISKNLLEPINCESHYFKIFGSTEPRDLGSIWTIDNVGLTELAITKYVVYYDQEPIYTSQFDKLYQFLIEDSESQGILYSLSCHTLDMMYFKTKFLIFNF